MNISVNIPRDAELGMIVDDQREFLIDVFAREDRPLIEAHDMSVGRPFETSYTKVIDDGCDLHVLSFALDGEVNRDNGQHVGRNLDATTQRDGAIDFGEI